MAFLVVLALILWVSGAWVLDRWGSRVLPQDSYDAIIVAGCRVTPDGRASPALKRRTARAVQLWREGYAPVIVFTGGVGEYPPSEAQAASDHAARLGLPRQAMVLEEQSTSTEENARFAARLLGERGEEGRRAGARRVLVVTDSYHAWRAEHVFARYFPEVFALGSQPSRSVRARGALREVLAVAWYGVAGRL